ncbi:MAG: DegT/DnrJ/EryC1/StrS family aminotransferase [Planctomycetes bacterium]|nr:DegT/DnrJ/EryC1/StrS family aminotransferase [Planctomycetota bacterium]
MARFGDILDRRWLTNDGPMVRAFEAKVAELSGVRHCVAICNGTIALEIMIRAAGLAGQVIVPSYTFVATAHALQWQEIQPVFCDVDPATHNLDPARVDALVTPRTTGIIGVHLWGRPCDVEGLEEVAKRRGLTLLFDASHAFLCSRKGRMVGGFGSAEVLSFHATKFCNAFEGGAILTNDDDLAEKSRLMRNFGFAGKDRVIYLGSNGKMTEVCAAMGLTSIESAPEFIAANREHWLRYKRRLAGLPGLSVIEYDPAERNNYHYVIVEVDAAKAGLTRDQIVQVLESENVLARRYFAPGAHRMEPYKSEQPLAGFVLPVTLRLAETVFALPSGSAVGAAEVEAVCDIMETAIANAAAVAAKL